MLLASILIAVVTIYQYNEEAIDYHKDRLERKETAIISHINKVIQKTTWEVTTENIPLIFKSEIYNIADIHSLRINLYDLDGTILKSSKASFKNDSIIKCIDTEVLNAISNSVNHRHVVKNRKNGETLSIGLYLYL